MLQVLQDLSSGDVEVSDIPSPAVLPGTVLVRNHFSLISSGIAAASAPVRVRIAIGPTSIGLNGSCITLKRDFPA